jgi:hypothetical protein
MENYINDDEKEYNSFIYQWEDIKLNKFYIGSHYRFLDKEHFDISISLL